MGCYVTLPGVTSCCSKSRFRICSRTYKASHARHPQPNAEVS